MFATMVKVFEPRHEMSNNVVSATNKDSNQPVHILLLLKLHTL